MAVAAYASVLSLLRVLDNVQHPSRIRLFPDAKQIDSLRDELYFLQGFLEVHSSIITKHIEGLVRKIPEVTKNVESLIDNYVVDELYQELCPQNIGQKKIDKHFVDEINVVIEKINSIIKALKKLKTIQHDQEQPGKALDKFSGDKPLKNKMVGFDDQLKQVLEKLTGNQRELVIVPIVGMGGIGKTTLARSVFDHPYNLRHFHVRIWLTISQDYNVKRVLQGLLNDSVLCDTIDREGDESVSLLIVELHKKLFDQRYLIVLDDVWSLEAWDDLKRGFPDNGKGSRVIVTTRLSEIANYLDSANNSYTMKFLDENKSWELFSEKAFEQGGWPLELDEIAREISIRCRGLPLLLVVIGGLLASSNMKIEYWETVKENINSVANSADDEYCLRILALSYHHLPIHLKPCFLYLRHFDEDGEIKVSKLIKRWISQGFVKPMRGKSLEEAARMYLEDLIGRNMLLIRKRGHYGNIRFCGIHDLLRDFCIKESEKEQLVNVPRMFSIPNDFSEVCLLCRTRCTDETIMLCSKILDSESKYFGKTLICSSCKSAYPDIARSRFVSAINIDSRNVPLMTKCRGLSIDGYESSFDFLRTINLLWNLETFHAKKGSCMPQVFMLWKMPQLRHMKIDCLMSYSLLSLCEMDGALENLQTLYRIRQFKCHEENVRRVPNLRKLSIEYRYFPKDEDGGWSFFDLQNLVHLEKLESLSIKCSYISMDFNAIAFPWSLKKLTLKGCRITWDDLTIIGSLPNLQLLHLLDDSIVGEEWNPVEGEFLALKCLELVELDLVRLIVDHETHFPALETLVLERMRAMKEIPREIGELPNLDSIYSILCRPIIVDSAKSIVEEQMNFGNERLVLHVQDFKGETYQIGGANHV